MPKSLGTTVENQFIQGLVTEATGLNFPEKAVIATENCKFLKTGSVVRRLGIEFEENYETNDYYGSDGAVSEYYWKFVGDITNKHFVLVQQGSGISFFEPDSDGNISANPKSFSINLLAYKVAGASAVDLEQNVCDYAHGDGKLFISHPFCEAFYIEYDNTTDDITITQYNIETRDFEGVEDNLEVDERPATLSVEHNYNLFNQGWYLDEVWADDHGNELPIDFFLRSMDLYPSNADVWWYYKNSKGEFDPNPEAKKNVFGNTPAAKGHYIYNAFSTDRSSQDRMLGALTETTSNGARPSCTAFYAGRVWYGGVNHPEYAGNVYYTQIIEEKDQIGKCYQHNDPTNENLSDLLDTDGGVVRILESSGIISMVPVRNALLVFCKNGVWSIGGSGAEGTGFVATDFSVAKISDVPAISINSFINVEGTPVWWNYHGIYTIASEGGVQAASLTDETIKTYFQDILSESIKYSKGAYNPTQKIIQWLYRSTPATVFPENYKYDKILNMNVLTRAFYPWGTKEEYVIEDVVDSLGALVTSGGATVTTSVGPLPVIRGILCLDAPATATALENVKDSSGTVVTDSALANVTVNVATSGESFIPAFKYVTTIGAYT